MQKRLGCVALGKHVNAHSDGSLSKGGRLVPATRKSAKRSTAAKKAAVTRRAKSAKRSTAAKKAATTRRTRATKAATARKSSAQKSTFARPARRESSPISPSPEMTPSVPEWRPSLAERPEVLPPKEGVRTWPGEEPAGPDDSAEDGGRTGQLNTSPFGTQIEPDSQ